MLHIDEDFQRLLGEIEKGDIQNAREEWVQKIINYAKNKEISKLQSFLLTVAQALLPQSPILVEKLLKRIEKKQLKKLDFDTFINVMPIPDKNANLLYELLIWAQKCVNVPPDFQINCQNQIVFNWYKPLLKNRDLYSRYDWLEKLELLPINLAEELRKPENIELFREIILHAFHSNFGMSILGYLGVNAKDVTNGVIDKYLLLKTVDFFPDWTKTRNLMETCKKKYDETIDNIAEQNKKQLEQAYNTTRNSIINNAQQNFDKSFLRVAYLLELGANQFLPEIGLEIIEKLIDKKTIVNLANFKAALALLLQYELDINKIDLLKYVIDCDIKLAVLEKLCAILLEFGADPSLLVDTYKDENKQKLISQLKAQGDEFIKSEDFESVLESRLDAALEGFSLNSQLNKALAEVEEKLNLLIHSFHDEKNDPLMNLLFPEAQNFYEIKYLAELINTHIQSSFVLDKAIQVRIDNVNQSVKDFSESVKAAEIIKAANKNFSTIYQDENKLAHMALESSGHAIVIFNNIALASKIEADQFLSIASTHQDQGFEQNVTKKLNSLINQEILRRLPEIMAKTKTYDELFALTSSYLGVDEKTTNIIQHRVGEEIFGRMKANPEGLINLGNLDKIITFYERKIYSDPTTLTSYVYGGGGATVTLISEEAIANNQLCQKLKTAYNFAILDQLDLEISKKFNLAAETKSSTPWKLGWFGSSTSTVTIKEAVYDVPNTIYQLIEYLDEYRKIDRNQMESEDSQTKVVNCLEKINDLLMTSKSRDLNSWTNWLNWGIGCDVQPQTSDFYSDMNKFTERRFQR